MTDHKALIAEARRAETDWTIGPGEMRELASRLAAALEEATNKRERRPDGVAKTAVRLAVDIIRDAQEPMPTRMILRRLEARGVKIGGSNPIANLSGFLCRSEQLKCSRANGWILAEWAEDFPSARAAMEALEVAPDTQKAPPLPEE